jgi:hypothetical protein
MHLFPVFGMISFVLNFICYSSWSFIGGEFEVRGAILPPWLSGGGLLDRCFFA